MRFLSFHALNPKFDLIRIYIFFKGDIKSLFVMPFAIF